MDLNINDKLRTMCQANGHDQFKVSYCTSIFVRSEKNRAMPQSIRLGLRSNLGTAEYETGTLTR
jgi:hypothetical protein